MRGQGLRVTGALPLLHLDHVYHSADLEVTGVQLVRTRRTLVASDHLPIVVDFVLR